MNAATTTLCNEEVPAIECLGVASGYPGQAPLMNNINFTIKQGEIVFLLGGSGCGKSTLLKHIIGQVPVHGGTIRILGQEMTRAEGAQRDAILHSFGMMYQGGALFGNQTVLENVCLPLEEFTDYPPELRVAIGELKLAQVGILDCKHKMPAELSGGQKKRAAIARAMALEPPILFLDEPSAGLDPVTSAELDQTIKRLAEEFHKTIVIISHEVASICEIATHVIYLDKRVNGVLDQGTVEHISRADAPTPIYNFFHARHANTPSN